MSMIPGQSPVPVDRRVDRPGFDRVQGTRRIVSVMGTAFTLDLHDLDPRAPAVDEVVAWWRWVDDTFSTYRPRSAVSRLAAGSVTLSDCPVEVAEVLDLCRDATEASDGYFTDHPGGVLDPSGMVKGWSVEIASRMLSDAGSAHHCITAGGDIRCAGEPAPGSPWRLGIVDPFDSHRIATVVSGTDLAVATSGTAERGLHIVDPHTGEPATTLASVTLVGTDLTRVDAMATAAFAMGDACRGWLAKQTGLEGFVVSARGEVWRTPGFPDTGIAPALAAPGNGLAPAFGEDHLVDWLRTRPAHPIQARGRRTLIGPAQA